MLTNKQLKVLNVPLGRIQDRLGELMEELEEAMVHANVGYRNEPMLERLNDKMADAVTLIDKIFSID